MRKTITCISCPVGCTLTAEVENGRILRLSGNKCPRGEKYAGEELIHPQRMLTTTIYIKERDTMLPVRSAQPVPKERLRAAVGQAKRLPVVLPVKMGQTLGKVEGTQIIASRDME